jgi:hypothetical protein
MDPKIGKMPVHLNIDLSKCKSAPNSPRNPQPDSHRRRLASLPQSDYSKSDSSRKRFTSPQSSPRLSNPPSPARTFFNSVSESLFDGSRDITKKFKLMGTHGKPDTDINYLHLSFFELFSNPLVKTDIINTEVIDRYNSWINGQYLSFKEVVDKFWDVDMIKLLQERININVNVISIIEWSLIFISLLHGNMDDSARITIFEYRSILNRRNAQLTSQFDENLISLYLEMHKLRIIDSDDSNDIIYIN